MGFNRVKTPLGSFVKLASCPFPENGEEACGKCHENLQEYTNIQFCPHLAVMKLKIDPDSLTGYNLKAERGLCKTATATEANGNIY